MVNSVYPKAFFRIGNLEHSLKLCNHNCRVNVGNKDFLKKVSMVFILVQWQAAICLACLKQCLWYGLVASSQLFKFARQAYMYITKFNYHLELFVNFFNAKGIRLFGCERWLELPNLVNFQYILMILSLLAQNVKNAMIMKHGDRKYS